MILKKIEWSDDLQEAFLVCKKCLSENILRAQPNFSKPFTLTTDASETAIGTILAQEQDDGGVKMVYAYSKTLDSAQHNYSLTDKELLVSDSCPL